MRVASPAQVRMRLRPNRGIPHSSRLRPHPLNQSFGLKLTDQNEQTTKVPNRFSLYPAALFSGSFDKLSIRSFG